MRIPDDLTEDELARLFADLGADDPRSYARSQKREGINHLHGFLFLREAWKLIVADGDTEWIERQIASLERDDRGPYAGIGRSLARLKAAGADPQDIGEVVRGMQAEFLFGLLYMIDDPDFGDERIDHIGFGLFEADTDREEPGARIGSLYEEVLATDPTGREMRPCDLGQKIE